MNYYWIQWLSSDRPDQILKYEDSLPPFKYAVHTEGSAYSIYVGMFKASNEKVAINCIAPYFSEFEVDFVLEKGYDFKPPQEYPELENTWQAIPDLVSAKNPLADDLYTEYMDEWCKCKICHNRGVFIIHRQEPDTLKPIDELLYCICPNGRRFKEYTVGQVYGNTAVVPQKHIEQALRRLQ